MMRVMHVLVLGLFALTANAQNEMSIEQGVFEPSWQSLSANYQAPQWFSDAKLGIWAHWGLQCVPEAGDWYARAMYQQDQGKYREHCKRYGPPYNIDDECCHCLFVFVFFQFFQKV